MKPLNSGPEGAIFRKLTNGLNKVGDCLKVGNSIIVEFGRTDDTGAVGVGHPLR